MLDEPALIPPDKLRLIILYVLFKQGIVAGDINKLLLHAHLPPHDQSLVQNLELLGARVTRPLKDKDARPQTPLFQRKPPPINTQEEVLISRFEPALKQMLEEHIRGTLDAGSFPYARPDQAPLPSDMLATQSAASLRSAKPTWAFASSNSAGRPRERILVFMAGGATYSEARACYEIAHKNNRDVVLMTSHMLTPITFLGQLADLSADRRRLHLPADRPAKRAPEHLLRSFETPPPPQAQSAPGRPPAQMPPREPARTGRPQQGGGPGLPDRMAGMNLNGGDGSGKPKKEEKEKKKKHGFFR
jgi:syntaxin-binding protein 1